MIIKMSPLIGSFGENKDKAKEIRESVLIPALQDHQAIIIDFSGVTTVTQSFIHALISDLFRQFGPSFLDHVKFKNCSPSIQTIIETVVEYMQ